MSQKKADHYDHLNQHIPVLTDLADQKEDRHTIAVLNVTGDQQSESHEPPTLKPILTPGATESELKARLREQGQRLIQEIITEERVRIEAQLSRELNHYLDHLLSQMPENLTD